MPTDSASPQTFGERQSSPVMPANCTIYLIRHAEKPDSGSGLSLAGQERAQAYVVYFQNLTNPAGETIQWDYLFASKDSEASHRPFLTLLPLAYAINKTIDPQFKDKDYSSLVDDIQTNSEKKFDNSNILICWHHGEILELAQSLGVKCSDLPPSSNWPKTWPEDVFGWLLQIYYKEDGSLHHKETQAISEKLMHDDTIEPVYKK
jgi:hypothetical protein